MMTEQDEGATRREKIKGYSQLDFYGMSKSTLIKNIQILVHELKIYYRLEEEKGQLSHKNQAKQQAQNQILIESYKQNEEKLKSKLTLLSHQLQNMEALVKEKDIEINKLTKQVEIYRKKAQQYDKMGGKIKMMKFEQTKKVSKEQIQELINENNKLRKQVLQANKKCKILEQLNRQTEMQAAEQLLEAKKLQSNTTTSIKKNVYTPQKENDSQLANSNGVKQTTIEMYALKEQVKMLREQLRDSQESKQKLKSKINERQAFYSKMMIAKY